MSVYPEQVTPQGAQTCPCPRVATPSAAGGGVGLALAYEGCCIGTHISQPTLLGATHIAVAHEGDLFALDGDDTVEDVFSRSNLGQHGIALVYMGDSGEHDAVAAILKERTHAIASYTNGGGVPFGEEFAHLKEEEVVG